MQRTTVLPENCRRKLSKLAAFAERARHMGIVGFRARVDFLESVVDPDVFDLVRDNDPRVDEFGLSSRSIDACVEMCDGSFVVAELFRRKAAGKVQTLRPLFADDHLVEHADSMSEALDDANPKSVLLHMLSEATDARWRLPKVDKCPETLAHMLSNDLFIPALNGDIGFVCKETIHNLLNCPANLGHLADCVIGEFAYAGASDNNRFRAAVERHAHLVPVSWLLEFATITPSTEAIQWALQVDDAVRRRTLFNNPGTDPAQLKTLARFFEATNARFAIEGVGGFGLEQDGRFVRIVQHGRLLATSDSDSPQQIVRAVWGRWQDLASRDRSVSPAIDTQVDELVMVACRDVSGVSTIVPITVQVYPDEYDLGEHYSRAERAAAEAGYEGPFVCFDRAEMRAIVEAGTAAAAHLASRRNDATIESPTP